MFGIPFPVWNAARLLDGERQEEDTCAVSKSISDVAAPGGTKKSTQTVRAVSRRSRATYAERYRESGTDIVSGRNRIQDPSSGLRRASPTANAAGTTAQPGWNRPSRWESSVSSAWAAMPLANAAFVAVVRMLVPQTVASGVPP